MRQRGTTSASQTRSVCHKRHSAAAQLTLEGEGSSERTLEPIAQRVGHVRSESGVESGVPGGVAQHTPAILSR
jgi:hypothetical protein